MFLRRPLLVVLLLVVLGIGCQTAEPETVEVPFEVEVTRIVEVPVETAAPEPQSINPMLPIEFDTTESSATGREYTVTVVLPLSYSMSDASYPVLYVTDGDFYAIPLGMSAAQLAFGQEVPEFITVGVDYGNPNPMEWLDLREVDMGPGGREQFLKFFKEELIPDIESAYRADPANRTLVGHSSGGDFALYALLNGRDTFGKFIASSPGTAGGWVPTVEDFANQGDTPSKLYFSVGDLDEETTIAGVQAFEDALVESDIEGLDHEMMILDNETHLSARPRAFNNGVRWLFSE